MSLTDLTGQDEPRSSVAAREGVDYSDRLSSRAIELNDLDDEDEAQFLRTPKRVPVRRSPLPKKTQNQVKKVLIIAVVVAGFYIVAWALHRYGTQTWRFRIDSSDNIEIAGVQNATRAQVMDVVGDDIGRNIFSVPLEEHKKKLEAIPWIESATVVRLLPNRIAIHVQERTPVAFVQIGSKISLIDGNGVVMGLPANRQVKYSFPVIQGMTETEPLSSRAAAMKIYTRLLRELDSEGGNDSHGQYSKDLSEVDLSDPEDVKVTAKDPGGAVVIHLGNANFLASYKLYVAHVAEWRQQFQNLQSVDLRYEGQIIVNPDANRSPQKPVAVAGRRRR